MLRHITNWLRALTGRNGGRRLSRQELFDQSPIPIILFDQQSRQILDVNSKACLEYGYTREQFLQLNVFDLHPASEREAVRNAIRHAHKTDQRSGPWRHLRADGSQFPVEIVSHEVMLSGRPARLVKVIDVGQRESANERFRILFEYSSDPHFLFDEKGIVDCNQAAVTRVGAASKRDLIGKHPAALSPDYQPDGQRSDHKRIEILDTVQAKGHHRFEWMHQKLNGEELPCEVSITTVEIEGQRILLCIWRDMVERQRAEKQIRLLSTVALEASNAIVITDAQRRVLWVNPAFEVTTGFESQEIAGRPTTEFLYGPETATETLAIVNAAMRTKVPVMVELEVRRKDGSTFWSEVHFAPVLDKSGRCTHFISVSTDITERKKNEADLRAAMAAAEAGAKAKSEFLAMMSHEIRTPLNGVIGMTSLLLESELTSEQREQLETIRASGSGLLSVVNDILDFSKIEAGRLLVERLAYDPRQLMEETLEMVAGAAYAKGLELQMFVDPGCPETLWGDPARIRQILLNYLSNAIKFTSRGEIELRLTLQGGAIRFEVADTGIGLTDEQQARLFLPFSQADSSTTRRFGGTGLGLAISKGLAGLMKGSVSLESRLGQGSRFALTLPCEASQASAGATRPFAGKRAAIVGSGGIDWHLESLGFAVSRLEPEEIAQCQSDLLVMSLAVDCDPSAWLETAKERNTPVLLIAPSSNPHFRGTASSYPKARTIPKPVRYARLELAASELLTQRIEPTLAGTTASSVKQMQGRVLVAEDNLVNQQVIRMMLQRLGCSVHVVGDGSEAVKAVQSGSYNFVLMDCQMPVMDGYEATRQIRALDGNKAELPIVALTANVMPGEADRCREAGMDGYLTKPITPDVLRQTISAWLAADQAIAS